MVYTCAAASSRPVAASAGRMASAPATGSDAPSQMTGGASVINPARAAWRSAVRPAGRARGSSAGPSPTRPFGAGASATAASERSARLTELSETSTADAISSIERPVERSDAISARLASVSFEGPLGPGRRTTSASTPPAAYEERQRTSESSLTPNAAATRRCLAALVLTNCTAASRRAARSPPPQLHPAIPHKNTEPFPATSSRNATPSATRSDPAGAKGRGCTGSSVPARLAMPQAPSERVLLRADYRTHRLPSGG